MLKEVRRAVRRFLREADMLLLVLCLVASAIGMVLISSALRSAPEGAGAKLIIQAAAIAGGVVLFVLFSVLELENIATLWQWILVFNIGFIALLVPFGTAGDSGNKSWLSFSFLPFSIQPAEVVKVSFVLLLAKQLSVLKERDSLNHVLSVASLVAHLGLMCGLIFVCSKDGGMIVVYVVIFFAMCLMGGLKWRWFAVAGAALAGAAPFIWNNLLEPYQRDRILIGFNPELDPSKYGWQPLQSKTAIGGGQLWGQGLYQGVQIQFGDVPAKQTDFIFAVLGEEFGFVGSMFLLLLLAVIILRCFWVASRARSDLASLVCIGIGGMLLCQTIINVGMCLALTPVIGLTLPFVSSGGSSILTMFAAMGLVSSAKMRPKTHWLKD